MVFYSKKSYIIIYSCSIVLLIGISLGFLYIVSVDIKNSKRQVTIQASDEESIQPKIIEGLEDAKETKEIKETKIRVGEIQLLKRIVMAEAVGEPMEGQIAVANVVLNRVRSPWYPDSIEEVIFQHGQFNPTWDGSLERVNSIKPTAKLAVIKAIAGYEAVPESTLFFLNKDIASDMTIPNTRTYVEKIGNHTFYR